MHIAVALELTQQLLPSLERIHAALKAKAQQYSNIIKIGRTHTQVCLFIFFTTNSTIEQNPGCRSYDSWPRI